MSCMGGNSSYVSQGMMQNTSVSQGMRENPQGLRNGIFEKTDIRAYSMIG